MPPANDSIFNEEDTPDDLKGPIKSRKKKQKKGVKQKAADEYKDSSSEGPKLSPDLLVALPSSLQCRFIVRLAASGPNVQVADADKASRPPIIDHTNPSPPPSPRLDDSSHHAHGDSTTHHLGTHFDKSTLLSNNNRNNNNTVLSAEPSPPQDGVLAAKHGTSDSGPPPVLFAPFSHVPSLSSSPQGGIQLPPNPELRTYSTSPIVHTASPPAGRRASMTAHAQRLATFHDPPPPHMPQRHFTRRPDMDFASSRAPDAAARPHYCGFDSLEKANSGTSAAANNVVLLGSQGRLEVHRLLRQRADIAGRLEGLPGSVIDAKILPWTGRHDPFSALRPLVVCVLHNPVSDANGETKHSLPSTERNPSTLFHQTSVQVYSLRSAELLATLYKSPPTLSRHTITPPTSGGDLKIAAEGPFIAIASSISGEVHIFAPYSHDVTDGAPLFRCIGKFWTTTGTTSSAPSPTVGTHGTLPDDGRNAETKAPIYALSQRWLAIKPPLLSSSQISLHGSPLLSPMHPEPPGVSTPVSPSPPLTNCDVDAPFSSSFLDRMAKQATQEFRRGAQWVGEQGKQAWKAYWNRSSLPPPNNGISQSPEQGQLDTNLFPPTHAHHGEPQPLAVEPALVSIIDLHKLLEFEENPSKNALTPLVTFALPDGCSFMSFAPGGLSLFTANQIGDASTIWDLTRITKGKLAAPHTSAPTGSMPYVASVARFARQTPSIVADVSWSPYVNRVAILTQKGTVHLHELPSSTFPPSLQSGATSPHAHIGMPSPGSSPQSDPSVAGFMTNFRTRLQTFRAPANPGATVRDASLYARNTGRRAIKQGVNMAADTALKFRHHEETKIRLQSSQHASLGLARLRWLSGRDSGLIATIIDGKVRLYAVKSNHYEQDKRTVLYLTASKRPLGEICLYGNGLSSDMPSPAIGGGVPDDTTAEPAKPRGFWALNRTNTMQRARMGNAAQLSASVVQDKDTNPMYLPLHRYSQVNLYTYVDPKCANAAGKKPAKAPRQGMGSDESWVFGLQLPPAKMITHRENGTEDYARQSGDGGVGSAAAGLREAFKKSSEPMTFADGSRVLQTPR